MGPDTELMARLREGAEGFVTGDKDLSAQAQQRAIRETIATPRGGFSRGTGSDGNVATLDQLLNGLGGNLSQGDSLNAFAGLLKGLSSQGFSPARGIRHRMMNQHVLDAIGKGKQANLSAPGGGIRTAGGLQAPQGLVPSGPRGSSLSGAGQRSASLQGLNMPDMLSEMRRRKEAEEAMRRQQAIIERGQNIRNERAATGLDQRTALFEMLKRFM